MVNNRRLGDYIEEVDERAGKNSQYSLKDIRGISSITKLFQKTKANLVDVSPAGYKVVKPMQFAFNPNTARMGDKIPIALNMENKNIIVSSIYPVFMIKDTNALDPQYLWLWFKRSEFDRYARFKSHGSAREIFSWEEMCNVELPVPSIAKQREIVSLYNLTISNIENNNENITRLRRLAEFLYKQSIIGVKEEKTIKELSSKVVTGKTPSTEKDELWGDSIPFVTIPDMHGNTYIEETGRSLSDLGSKTQKTTMIPEDSIVVSCIATVGLVGISTRKCHTNQQINSVILKNDNDKYFVYESLLNNTQELKSLGEGGSATLNVSKSKFENFKIKYPTEDIRGGFSKACEPIFETIHALEDENRHLIAMSDVIIHSMKKLVRRNREKVYRSRIRKVYH